jgi:hypothetical protein
MDGHAHSIPKYPQAPTPLLPSFESFIRDLSPTPDGHHHHHHHQQSSASSTLPLRRSGSTSPPVELRFINTSGRHPHMGVLIRSDKSAPALPKTRRLKRSSSDEISPNEDDFECEHCGKRKTPEKRIGPNGKRTLCNSCGLKWARDNKKQAQNQEK